MNGDKQNNAGHQAHCMPPLFAALEPIEPDQVKRVGPDKCSILERYPVLLQVGTRFLPVPSETRHDDSRGKSGCAVAARAQSRNEIGASG